MTTTDTAPLVANPEPTVATPRGRLRLRRRAAAVPRTSAPAAPLPMAATLAVNSLLVLTALAVWLVGYVFAFSGLQEHHSQSVLYSHFREQLSLGTAPPFGAGTALKSGDPVALITAPSIGLHNTVVVEGSTSGDLQAGPGHLPGTVLPGETGVSTILGRAAAYGAPFRHLTALKAGAPLTVTTGQGVFHYSVVDVRGPGAKVPGSLAAVSSRLTLATAANSGWRDLWSPTHAVFVDAAMTGKALPVASGPAATSADNVMSGDSAALVPLVLWLEGLLLIGVGTVWTRSRWGRAQVWLIGVPVILALLWGASGAFIQLLPNLF